MNKLMEWQSINSEVSGFLASLVAAGYNIFISGGTGSGKTTENCQERNADKNKDCNL